MIRSFAIGMLGLLALIGSANAQDSSAHALFTRGVAEYEQGEFERAADTFTEILASGVVDPAVHYNLGNAMFKSGRLGLAIYHYRRAHALSPRDEDTRANLEYARFLALDRLEDEGARTDLRVEGWFDRVTAGEIFRLATGLWILAATAAVLWQLSPSGGSRWRRASVVLAGAWLVAVVGAWGLQSRAKAQREAVVLPLVTDVRNGPGDAFETAFVLHEGAEVVVEGERGEWTEISLPGDLRGWISSESIATL